MHGHFVQSRPRFGLQFGILESQTLKGLTSLRMDENISKHNPIM